MEPRRRGRVGVGLILYVEVDTLLNRVSGWRQLMEEVKVATTFEQIRDAGERFGKLLGREAARAFAMLLMAAIGSTAKLFASKLPTLPGSAQAATGQADRHTGNRTEPTRHPAATALNEAHIQALFQTRR